MGLYLFVMSLNWSAYQTWYQIKLHLLCVSFLFFSTFKSAVSYIFFVCEDVGPACCLFNLLF